MLSKPSRSSSPERHTGQKRSAPSTPKEETESSEVARKLARNATEAEPPVAQKTESHPLSHDSSPTEEARSHDTQFKHKELTERADQTAKSKVGEVRAFKRCAQCKCNVRPD